MRAGLHRAFAAAAIFWTGAYADAAARDAPPANGWSARFDRRAGETAAVYRSADGAQLALICDSAGTRPGRGRIEAMFLLERAPTAFPASVGLDLKGGSQSVQAWAASVIVPVLQPKSGRNAQAAAALLTGITLDGSTATADLMRRFVVLFQQGAPDLTLRAHVPEASFAIKGSAPARILKSFEQGCQNFLPAADDEVIWDWHQGLALRDGRRSVTLVAQAQPSHADGARLSLHCDQNKLQMTLSGWPSVIGKPQMLMKHSGETRIFALETARSDSVAIAAHSMKPLLAALTGQELLTLSVGPDAPETITIPVAGFSLASRLMAAECPAQMP